MTITEIISEHLAPDWTTNLPDLETLRVLLDRIRDEKECSINKAGYDLVELFISYLLERMDLPMHTWAWEDRQKVKYLIFIGKWHESWNYARNCENTKRHLPELLKRLVSVAESLGLDPNSVPD